MRIRAIVASAAWVLLLVLSTVPVAAGDPTTVILVRHAEKLTGSDDPGLSEDGKARVAALVHQLADAPIAAVYSTPFVRTRETARPVAERLGLEITVTPIDDGVAEHVADVPRRILADHPGKTVLVVGHSNTVPAILGAMGIDSAPELTEKDYDDLFVVTLERAGEARVLHLHYGAPSP